MSHTTAEQILKLPYSRVIIPDEDTGMYTGLIAEFPGCITQGYTPEETYNLLQDAAIAWIETTLEIGQSIPGYISWWRGLKDFDFEF